jgi:hypothetical protein
VATSAVQAIKNEIERKQAELDALKAALAALGGTAPAKGRRDRGDRRPRTNAEKKALSKAMKASWRRRKAERTASPTGRKTKGKKAAGLESG